MTAAATTTGVATEPDRIHFRQRLHRTTDGMTTVQIQIVEFNLRVISDADYRSACDGLAKVLARVPGLVSMAWLANDWPMS